MGNKYNSEAGLADRCSARRGDFQTLPFEDAQYDAAYQIEATCHSPDRVSWLLGPNLVFAVNLVSKILFGWGEPCAWQKVWGPFFGNYMQVITTREQVPLSDR